MNKKIAKGHLLSYLRSHKKNISIERFIIFDTIFQQSSRLHFKAEELVATLRRGPQSVSRATVYRTLKIFEEAGIIRSMPDSYEAKPQKSYEIIEQEDGHGHLICRHCSRITEYHCAEIIKHQNIICRQHNFRPDKRIEQIYGSCSYCQRKLKNKLSEEKT